MIKPAMPVDEASRLSALRALNLLDTDAEERFDRVTRLARRMFGVEIALVSLVDSDRQWFKSRQGLCAEQTGRDISFCGHAILDDGVLHIPDACEDPRFHDNPLVTGDPAIRFYAGVPLRAPDGAKLGTLCVIDSSPRALSAEDVEMLCDLAAMVEREIAAVQIATMDELTSLTNRRGFDVISRHVTALCRRVGSRCAIMFFDLDGFKAINDDLGHLVGDEALQSFARLLLDNFRDSDVVARIGGDEFCVLMSGTALDCSGAPLERLRKAVQDHNQDPAVPYELRYSVGSVDYDPGQDASFNEVMAEADSRMYVDKQAGDAESRRRR